MEEEVLPHGSGARLAGRSSMHTLWVDDDRISNHQQISFGLSPAVAAFSIGMRSTLDHVLLTFFVLCGLTRLARFNVTVAALPKDKTGKSQFFEGTPIPTSLSLASVMAFWVSRGWVLEQIPFGTIGKDTLFELHPAVFLFVFHGCLMVSKTLHIPKP